MECSDTQMIFGNIKPFNIQATSVYLGETDAGGAAIFHHVFMPKIKIRSMAELI